MKKRTSIGIVLAFVLVSGASPARAQTFDHAGLASQMIERHVRPGYARLRDTAQNLEQAAKTFCTKSGSKEINPLQDAFRDTVLAWSRVSHLRFGPVTRDRRLTRMLYWPDRKNLGRRQVRTAIRKKDQSTLDVDALSGKSVAVQGLGAIEQLLYWKADGVFAEAGDNRSYRCGYLRSATKNVATISDALVAEWATDMAFPKALLSPGKDNPRYLKAPEVTLEMTRAFLVGLETLRDVKVAGSLGLRPNNPARVHVPFEPSGFSTRAMQAELEGLIEMYEAGGLMQAVERRESGMGKSILFELEQALAGFKQITLQIAEAVEDPAAEDHLIGTGFPLKNARAQVTRVLAEAAGLNLGFNAGDGD